MCDVRNGGIGHARTISKSGTHRRRILLFGDATSRNKRSSVQYSPALALKMINRTIQTRLPHVRDKATQTEAEAILLYRRIEELSQLWRTVAINAAGYTFAHGLPVDTRKVEDLQQWVNAAPQEFEIDVATFFSSQPMTRAETLERIRKLISNGSDECTHHQELAARMRNETTTTWEESLRGIKNLQALAPVTVVSWSDILAHFASLVRPTKEHEEIEELRDQLDDALMRLELLKEMSGGGPQRYSVPLFDACFTDVCSWNTWRNQAIAVVIRRGPRPEGCGETRRAEKSASVEIKETKTRVY